MAVKITRRNPVAIFIFFLITFGLYAVYWMSKTAGEINELGGDIPGVWMLIIPILNLYFFYRFSQDFSRYVMKSDNTLLWFVLWMVVSPVAMILMQLELNKLAEAQVGASPLPFNRP